MALKTITGKLARADGVYPLVRAYVAIAPSQATVVSGTSEVVADNVYPVVSLVDGTYTVSLQANADLTPLGTYYTVSEQVDYGPAYTFSIIVPGTAGPFVMSSIQTGVPPTASPTAGHLSTLTVDGAATLGLGSRVASDFFALSPPPGVTVPMVPSGGDDTTTFASAFAALPATGGKVSLGQGSYNVSARTLVTMLSGQHIQMEGVGQVTINSTMAEPGSQQGVFEFVGAADGTSRLTLRNFKISHTPTGNGNIDCIMVRYPGWPGSGPTNPSLARYIMEDVTLTGASRDGMRGISTSNGRITNCSMSGNKYGGLALIGDTNVVVLGGDYSNNISGTLLGDYGITFDSGGVTGPATYCKVIGVSANGNGRKGIDVHLGHNLHIIGNTCVGNGYNGIYAVMEDVNKDVGDITIADNTIDQTGGNATLRHMGIEIGSFGTPGGTLKPGSFIVTGNRVSNVDVGLTTSVGIFVHNPTSGPAPDKVIITDNTLKNGAGSTGQIIEAENHGVNIPYLKIADNILHAASCATAIEVLQATDVNVSDNLIQVDGAITNGISIVSTANAVVADNQINGAVPSGLAITNTSATHRLSGNQLNGVSIEDSTVGYDWGSQAIGAETISRLQITTSTALVSGTVHLSYFTATKAFTANHLRTNVGTPAAGATPTLCRVGLYTVAANGDLTLVASSANNTGLWASTFSANSSTFQASYLVVPGQRYAVALLIVTSFALPSLGVFVPGALGGSDFALAPQLASSFAGQTDLTTPITFGSLTTSNKMFYAAVIP